MRVPVIAGNWKMYKTAEEAVRINELKPLVDKVKDREVVICAPFTALADLVRATEGSNIAVGAQDVFWEEEGAYTGEVSPGMLTALGVKYVIIGHSERRQYFGETDETVNKKLKAAQSHGLIPIVCVGESLEQRQSGQTEEVVTTQVKGAFAGVDARMQAVIIAYEPIWAIGTGQTATSQQANETIALIRQVVAELYDEKVADEIRIQYGGSVKPGNVDELMGQSDIDGALVGGASLEADSFARIVNFVTDQTP